MAFNSRYTRIKTVILFSFSSMHEKHPHWLYSTLWKISCCITRSLYSLRHHHKISSYSLPFYLVRRLIRYRREIRAIRKAQWQEFCFQLEPKNTDYFWRHTKRLFRKTKPQLQGFIDPHTIVFFFDIFNPLLTANIYLEHWKWSKMILISKEHSSVIPINKTRPISHYYPVLVKYMNDVF